MLIHWCAFLALVGLGFVLISQRDDSRSWLAFNGAALCWIGGLLALRRGLSYQFGMPARDGWQVAVLATMAGPSMETAPERVVLTYGGGMVTVVLMLMALWPTLRTRYSPPRVLLIAAPAFILIIAFGSLVARQPLEPSRPLELHRFDASNLRSMVAYLVAAAIFNFVFMALVVGQLLPRMGSEEFLVLMPRADLGEAARLGDRLCWELRETPLVVRDGTVAITASIGLAQVHDLDRDAHRVLLRADAALYLANDSGRDRVEIAAV